MKIQVIVPQKNTDGSTLTKFHKIRIATGPFQYPGYHLPQFEVVKEYSVPDPWDTYTPVVEIDIPTGEWYIYCFIIDLDGDESIPYTKPVKNPGLVLGAAIRWDTLTPVISSGDYPAPAAPSGLVVL